MPWTLLSTATVTVTVTPSQYFCIEQATRLDCFFRSKENEIINPERILKRGQCIHKKAFRVCKKCNPKPPKKEKKKKKDGDDNNNDDDDEDDDEEKKREEEERKKEEAEELERLKQEEEKKKKEEEEKRKASLEPVKIVYIDEGECKHPIQERRLIKACKNGNIKVYYWISIF